VIINIQIVGECDKFAHGGEHVQILFNTEDTPQSYAEGNGKFPDAPEKCPHKGCHTPIKMRKHGFYERYIVGFEFVGKISVRRYICPMCGRTVSMLPSFCVPRLQYGVEVIILALLTAMQHNSTRYAGTRWHERPPTLTRRHLIYYRKRAMQNRGHIQLVLNLMSPEFVELKQITGDPEWTRESLKAANDTNPPRFNANYHELSGSSFMSLHNKVA
jgi:hypothetical protein